MNGGEDELSNLGWGFAFCRSEVVERLLKVEEWSYKWSFKLSFLWIRQGLFFLSMEKNWSHTFYIFSEVELQVQPTGQAMS